MDKEHIDRIRKEDEYMNGKYYKKHPEILDKKNIAEKAIKAEMSRFMIVFGNANNLAYAACAEYVDKARLVKNYSCIKQATERIMKELKTVESKLKYGNGPKFFEIAYKGDDALSIFVDDFDNEKYFELWTAIGYSSYFINRNIINSLLSKLKKVYNEVCDDVTTADAIAQAELAYAITLYASRMYETVVKHISTRYGINKQVVSGMLEHFCILKPLAALENSRRLIKKRIKRKVILEESKIHNIELSLGQVGEMFKMSSVLKAFIKSIEEYMEFFRSKKKYKQVLAEAQAELIEECEHELKFRGEKLKRERNERERI